MPPEYINKQTISQKFDVFSLGVIIIQMMAGKEGYFDCVDTPPEEFIKLVRTRNQYHGNHSFSQFIVSNQCICKPFFSIMFQWCRYMENGVRGCCSHQRCRIMHLKKSGHASKWRYDVWRLTERKGLL